MLQPRVARKRLSAQCGSPRRGATMADMSMNRKRSGSSQDEEERTKKDRSPHPTKIPKFQETPPNEEAPPKYICAGKMFFAKCGRRLTRSPSSLVSTARCASWRRWKGTSGTLGILGVFRIGLLPRRQRPPLEEAEASSRGGRAAAAAAATVASAAMV